MKDRRAGIVWVLLGLGGFLLAASMTVLAGPAWVYAGSPGDFAASPSQILGVVAPYLLGAVVGIAVVLALLPPRGARLLGLVLAALGVMLWVQGTFLVNDFGALDGQSWSIEDPWWRVGLELAGLLVLMVAVWHAAARAPRLVAALLALIAVVAVAEPASRLPDKPDLADSEEKAGIYAFSEEKNLLVVVLDGLTSDVFEQVIEEHPDILSALDGFIYHPDAAGVGATTVLSVPAIHSGRLYPPGMPVQDFAVKAITEDSFMNDLAAAGYHTTLLNHPFVSCAEQVDICAWAQSLLTSSKDVVSGEADLLLSLGIFRVAPLFLKELVYNDGKWLDLISRPNPRTAHPTVIGNSMMEEFAKNLSASAGPPTAKYLHLFSTHLPVAVNGDCAYVGDLGPSRAGYLQQAECGLTAFAELVAALRERGLYDRTAIILVSDHGSGDWQSPRIAASDDAYLVMLTRANVTFAYKPIGATGALRRDDSPMSLTDVPALACTLTSDCARAPETEQPRERYFNWYKWDSLVWNNNEAMEITTFRISGPVYDGRNWEKVERND